MPFISSVAPTITTLQLKLQRHLLTTRISMLITLPCLEVLTLSIYGLYITQITEDCKVECRAGDTRRDSEDGDDVGLSGSITAGRGACVGKASAKTGEERERVVDRGKSEPV
jgi:hypothetical protein